MQLRPVNDCLLVESIGKLPENDTLAFLAEEGLRAMRVLHTPDYLRDDQEVFMKGDRVVVPPGSGHRLIIDGRECLLIRQQDVLAILE